MIPNDIYTETENELAKVGYIVVCDTCGKTFFEDTLLGVMRLVTSNEWVVEKKMAWYGEAARHWWKHRKEKGEIHMINICIETAGVRNVYFGITSHWESQIWRDNLTDQQLEEFLGELLGSTNSKVVRE